MLASADIPVANNNIYSFSPMRSLKRQSSAVDAESHSDVDENGALSKTKKNRCGKISNEALLESLANMIHKAASDKAEPGLELTAILPTFQRLTGQLLNHMERCAQLKNGTYVTLLLAKEVELDAKKQVIYFCRVFIPPSRAQLSLTTAERSLNSFTTELYDTDMYVLAPDSDVLEREVAVHDHASLYNNPHLLPTRPLYCRYKYKHNGTLLLK